MFVLVEQRATQQNFEPWNECWTNLHLVNAFTFTRISLVNITLLVSKALKTKERFKIVKLITIISETKQFVIPYLIKCQD